MKPIPLPSRYNYIGVFLTMDCNLRCSYCINRFSGSQQGSVALLPGVDWVRGLERLVSRSDLPVTLQGGEPSLHPDFLELLGRLRSDLKLDVLTNLTFDAEEFIRRVAPERLRRDAPYASIRVSHHPETMRLEPLIRKVLRLQEAGFSVGIWGLLHPEGEEQILAAQKRCRDLGIDYRTKEFLGYHRGVLHGSYRYEGACAGRLEKPVRCRTSELLVGPSGEVYRCHSDLYAGRAPLGSLLDPNFTIEDEFRECSHFGDCNPCDVKVKTNRHQVFGHTSVEIVTGDDGGGAFPRGEP